MTGSDVYAGWVFPNGTFHIDDYLVGPKHALGCDNKGVCADVDQGCENNILTSSGSYAPPTDGETLGLMRLNFTRKLVTMDKCDYNILAGPVNIIVAKGRDNNNEPGHLSPHYGNHDAATVTFYTAPAAPINFVPIVLNPVFPVPVPVAPPVPLSAPVATLPPMVDPIGEPSVSPPTADPIGVPQTTPQSAPQTQTPQAPLHILSQGSANPMPGYALNWKILSPNAPAASASSTTDMAASILEAASDPNALIEVSITGKTDSWVGYGWNSDEVMPESDVVIGLRMDNVTNVVKVDDYKIGPKKRLGCGVDGQDDGVCLDTNRGCKNNVLSYDSDYTPAAEGEETGTLKISFRRLLVTGDSVNCDFSIGQGPTSVVYAMGPVGAPIGVMSSHRKNHASDTITYLPVPVAPSAPTPVSVPVAPTPTSTRPCPAPSATEFEHVMGSLEGRYKLYWTLRSVEDRLHLAMIAEGTGWVGFGIATATGEMVGSEAIIGWPGSVKSYTLAGRNVPSIHENPSIPLMDYCSAQFTGEDGKKWTVVRATRGVTAGDNAISMTGTTNVVVAYGPDNEFKLIKHSSDNREPMSVNFVSGSSNAAKPDARKIAHGVLMFISWGILLQFGAIFARYAKPLPNALWFKIHRIVQFGGFGIAVAGFILAIVMTTPPHFATTSGHAQVGLTVMILGVIQIAVAIFRPNPANVGQNKSIVRVLWEFSHWWIGRLSLILAVVAIFLGLVSIRAPFGYTIAWSVIVGLTCAGICGLELYRKFAIDRPQQAYEYVRLNPSDGLN